MSGEFEAIEAMCCDKRHQVAENTAPLMWEFLFMLSQWPQTPIYIIISYITSPQAWVFLQTLQCSGWVYPGNIIMLLQGHLNMLQRFTTLTFSMATWFLSVILP